MTIVPGSTGVGDFYGFAPARGGEAEPCQPPPGAPERPLSVPAAACYLLVWQQPTDRALAGWSPMGANADWLMQWDEPRTVQWLADQMVRSGAEQQSQGSWALDRLRHPTDPCA